MSYFPWVKGNTAKPMVECHLRDAVAYASLVGATVKLIYTPRNGPRTERTMEIVDGATGHVRYFGSASDASVLTASGGVPCQFLVRFADGSEQTYPNEGTDTIGVSLPL